MPEGSHEGSCASLPAILPVLDLMAAQVVRGVGGQRRAYRPIVSSLCPGSAPLAHARCLLAACAAPAGAGAERAQRLYLADLDAIGGGAVQRGVLAELLRGLPLLQELWLDAGFADATGVHALLAALREAGCGEQLLARVQPVFGSETLRSLEALQQALAAFPQALLSLDSRGGEALDPAGCWERPELWPKRVIVMSLHSVGSGAGPDLHRFGLLRAQRPTGQWFGAGGLRGPADLQAAAKHGAAGWLVASALHDRLLP